MRILIAADDSALAGFVRKGREAEHYALDVSGDGEQARSLASELDCDLIVLDLNFPRLDGVAILKQVRTKKPNVPIPILTARGKVEDREKIRRPQRSLDDVFLMRREFLRRER
jgi:two-component system copper resistance phosphate regulon response regulator CusR